MYTTENHLGKERKSVEVRRNNIVTESEEATKPTEIWSKRKRLEGFLYKENKQTKRNNVTREVEEEMETMVW